MKQIREQVKQEDVDVKSKSSHHSQTDTAKGFGGKYGVMKERQDKVCIAYIILNYKCIINVWNLQSALGYDYQTQLAKHGSQTDAAKGFGGKFGVQKERKDKVYMYTCPMYTVH